ncbi:MAG: DNA-directed RNA polymerase subunit omega [Clostridiales bacterium]|nr:DNA-directed RNA polymerase subunit omega [Clostridiales bacterium]
MDRPRLNDLMADFDSKYTLVIVAAKRARQLTAANPEAPGAGFVNPVSSALYEIVGNKVFWERL